MPAWAMACWHPAAHRLAPEDNLAAGDPVVHTSNAEMVTSAIRCPLHQPVLL